jgi:membrane associated rhomboid family serine protease
MRFDRDLTLGRDPVRIEGPLDLLKSATMGIYDRDWVRTGPPRRSAPGQLSGGVRGLSVTIWIIIICVGVHMLDGFLAPSVAGLQQPGAWTSVGRVFYAGENGEQPDLEGKTLRYLPPLDKAPAFRLPQTGRELKAVPIITGTRAIYAGDTQVGEVVYQNMPLLKRLGFFSTSRALIGWTGSGQLVGGEFWRFISFQFLHADFWHLLVNMFGLWIFGPLVERHLGGKRFLAFYLLCGIFGACMYLLLNAGGAALGMFGLSAPFLLFNDPQVPLIGASAGVFGVLLAGAFLAPNLMVLLFFIIPIRLVTLAYGLVVVALFTLIFNNQEYGSNAGGEAAHLGGAIAGFYFIRRQQHLHGFFDFLGRVDPTSRTARERRAGRGSRAQQAANAKADAEIDRILAKIHEHGLQSLSAKEKRILRASSKR